MNRKHCFSFVAIAVLFSAINAGARDDATPALRVEAADFVQKTIYHSPEKFGYTSWVGLWQMPDRRLECSFEQRTRGPGGAGAPYVSAFIVLESRDEGDTWVRVPGDAPQGGGRGMAVLADGTMVRPRWGDAKDPTASGYLERSSDGGRTWGPPTHFLPPAEYQCWPTLIRPLRDGRLVMMAGVWKRGDGNPGMRMTKMMFVSRDQGKTWSAPIVLMPSEQGVCEESDFCELPSGDLLWVHRVEHYPLVPPVQLPPGGAAMIPSADNNSPAPGYSDRYQSIVYKSGETWVAGPATLAPFPHSGFPCVLYTKEGLVLHLATDGIYWTAATGKPWTPAPIPRNQYTEYWLDHGGADASPRWLDRAFAAWTRLAIPGTKYYPRALQLDDGKIVCIGHVGGDNVYGTVNQAIVEQTFRLQVKAP
jgi:hypothetical protein